MKTCPANGLACKYSFCLPGVCSIQEVAKHQDITSCDNITVVAQPAQPLPGYTKEQMGEAYEQGAKAVLKDVSGRFDLMANDSSLHRVEDRMLLQRIADGVRDVSLPDRSTYLSTLPLARDPQVLVSAIEKVMVKISGMCDAVTDDVYSALNRALTQFNNP